MSEIIYGIHVIQTVLECDSHRFLDVYLLKGYVDSRLKKLVQQLEQSGVIIQAVSCQWLNKKVNGAMHQGIVARIKKRKQYQESNLPMLLAQQVELLLLILDGVTDPHNLGACLRCADAAGAHAVMIPFNRAVQCNATVKKVACGATETVKLIRVINLARTLKLLKEYRVWIVGTSSKAKRHLYKSKLIGSVALVMGSEGKGIRRLTREYCDELVSIPMAGVISSLNVSVAAGICLYEAIRQRTVK